MSLLVLMLLLFWECPTEASVPPVISFSPNWNPVVVDDSVTLTCNLDPNPEGEKRYSWYRDNRELSHYEKNYTIQHCSSNDRGNYQCQAGASEKSDAVRVDIGGPIVLQAPSTVREGDSLSLRCQSWSKDRFVYVQFYKDDTVMQPPGTGSVLQAGKALRSMTGTYRCAKLFDKHVTLTYSPKTFIYVTGAGIKPVVSINPEWGNILLMDSVTLSCNVEPTIQESPRYVWYKDGDWIREEQKNFTVKYAYEKDFGNYQCQIPGSERSESVRLDGKSGDFILQAPPTVHEGDLVYLRCHRSIKFLKSRLNTQKNITLHKDNEFITYSVTESPVLIGRADKNTSGTYKCTLVNEPRLSDELVISVTELFSDPYIKVNPGEVLKGDHMTITCDTKLSPHRETTKLQFAFYRNGHNVQGFSSSNQYGVPSAQLEHSGNYTCEVQTASERVRKMSNISHISIVARNQRVQNTVRLVLSAVIFIITLCLPFYHKKTMEVTYSQVTEKNR
ncbi:Fc receptor-like protein 5 [Xenopus laevis]|uniref:Fc receptor-like protein 5 n=1 Tax=Xenopus laevis TaxID=8355 RepID=A0A8J1LLR6_XENLA|nr:Fc receptor-like protein 5 [Xenopus laevis]